MKKSEVLNIRKLIEKAVESLTDNEAIQAKMLYPKWKKLIGTSAEVGFKFQYGSELYKVIQVHTFQESWTPDTATSLYERIDEQHDGTLEDPIPYNGNMVLENGKYYTEDGKIYLCNRDTVSPVYNKLVDLVGVYVQLV